MNQEDLEKIIRSNVRDSVVKSLNPEPPEKEPQEED